MYIRKSNILLIKNSKSINCDNLFYITLYISILYLYLKIVIRNNISIYYNFYIKNFVNFYELKLIIQLGQYKKDELIIFKVYFYLNFHIVRITF